MRMINYGIAALVSVCFSCGALAATENVRTKIRAILTDKEAFGGCYVFMTASTTLPDCAPRYAMFDCRGDTGVVSKSQSAAALANAQLAFVADFEILLNIDNTKKINGICLATTTSVFK